MRWIFAGVALFALACLAVLFWSRSAEPLKPPPNLPEPKRLWSFEAPQPGAAIAAPLITRDAVYLAALHQRGFRLTGAIYALNPETGKLKWSFDRDGDMLPTASSPVLAGGRLLFGEGMHANFACKLYALDPATGKPVWTIDTGDHIEGGPATDGKKVYFPAGNDGVYAANASTGVSLWNFREDVHIDSSPAVADDRIYVGSGTSRRFKNKWVICLDAENGKPLWRTPVTQPAWATPLVTDGYVYAGLGNGRLNESAQPPEKPAGGLACLEANTGKLLWVFPVADSVFTRPVIVGNTVIFGSRDGYLYGVSQDGRERFRLSMGGAMIGSPAIESSYVYAVSVPGRLVCVNVATGEEVWRHELAQPGAEPRVYAPIRVAADRLYVAAEFLTPAASVGIVNLSCFQLPQLPSARGRPEDSE